jgi:glycolate oxidase iron-sulfur subunit
MDELKERIDYAKSLDCVHCGLCLNSCPTYRISGAEASSPRGRIHLMRSIAEGALPADEGVKEELDYCLLCRNCESVCPSGVQFGQLMEGARDGAERAMPRTGFARLAREVGFGVLLRSRGALRAASALGRLAQRSGALELATRVLGDGAGALALAPAIPPARERARPPAFTPARGERLGAVAFLEGCVMTEFYSRVNSAAIRALSSAGFDVHVPLAHMCCGSLHAHNGELHGARELARETIAAFDAVVDGRGAPLPVVVDSAGCGSHMKEYHHLLAADIAWRERAQAFSRRVQDWTEWMTREPARSRVRSALQAGAEARRGLRATWDDPCHLCHGQGVRRPPRELIEWMGVHHEPIEDPEACCGSAGIYSLLRPADSQAVLAPRLAALAATRAEVLLVGNPGCHMQWEGGVKRAGQATRVLHIAEAVDRAMAGEAI